MNIKEIKREVTGYEVECPKCKQKIKGVSIKSVNHNYKMHKMFCKGYKVEKEK